jgi:hypothetical protein
MKRGAIMPDRHPPRPPIPYRTKRHLGELKSLNLGPAESLSILPVPDDYLVTMLFNGAVGSFMEGRAMKYMLLIYAENKAHRSEKEREDCKNEAVKLAEDLRAKGQYVAANPLEPTTTATSIRVRDGKRLVTDGPFAETHEQLGGYFLIEAKTLDEAIAVARKIPMAGNGTVEVRPVIEFP